MRLHPGQSIDAQGHLRIAGCDAVSLAHTYGTPLLVLDENAIRARCRAFVAAVDAYLPGGRVVYAGKAFSAIALCHILQQEGLYLDVTTHGELALAQAAGFPGDRIEMHGSNKSHAEIEAAIRYGVHRLIIDGLDEIPRVAAAARRLNLPVDVLLRMNPGVVPNTHHNITTSGEDTKFGLPIPDGSALQAVRDVLAEPLLRLHGIHFHVGSQVAGIESTLREAIEQGVLFLKTVHEACGLWLAELNLGGGYAVPYVDAEPQLDVDASLKAVGAALVEMTEKHGVPRPLIIIEPGRAIIAEAGVALYAIGAIKRLPGVRTYVSVDGGMMDNPRPILYDVGYAAWLANRMNDAPNAHVAIAGKACETDVLIWDADIPEPREGDILAMPTAGAYQYALSSNYLRVPRPAVVLVRGDRHAPIIERETFERVLACERVPDWIGQEEDHG